MSNGFLGRFEYQMDEKGRVSLPSAFRRGEEADRFVLIQWEKPYLTLFPTPAWSDFEQRLMGYRKSNPDAWHHVRDILGNAAHVAPDKQGRILVPPGLKEAASLDGTVVLNGNIDRIEVWNLEHYRAHTEKVVAEDVRQLVRQVFG